MSTVPLSHSNPVIVVAASKSWPLRGASQPLQAQVVYIRRKEDLTEELLARLSPNFIFFPHWEWLIPSNIIQDYVCVGFHAAPLPFGRGGSPIQNMLIRGYQNSALSSYRMNDAFDSGPIYFQTDFSLDGSLEEILSRMRELVWIDIGKIISQNLEPRPQTGDVVSFKRLRRADNEINWSLDIQKIYDAIRMVDDPDYGKAYTRLGRYRLEFSDASRSAGELTCLVKFIYE